jgi:hypothetical protein
METRRDLEIKSNASRKRKRSSRAGRASVSYFPARFKRPKQLTVWKGDFGSEDSFDIVEIEQGEDYARFQVQLGVASDSGSDLERDWNGNSSSPSDAPHDSRNNQIQTWTHSGGSYLSVTDRSIRDEATDPQPETLGDLLREAMVKATGPGKSQFLPIGALNSIITRERILHELQRQDIPEDHVLLSTDLHVVVDHILGTGSNAETSKRIFAILCLMELSLEVGTFMATCISDRHLPFEPNTDPEVLASSRNRFAPLCYRDAERSCWVPVSVFNNWKPHNIESFTSYQGWFLAPCFEFSSEARPKFSELHLHDCVVLPFMEEQRKDSAFGNQLELPSGCSVVRKVKIHPDHYTISGCHVSLASISRCRDTNTSTGTRRSILCSQTTSKIRKYEDTLTATSKSRNASIQTTGPHTAKTHGETSGDIYSP